MAMELIGLYRVGSEIKGVEVSMDGEVFPVLLKCLHTENFLEELAASGWKLYSKDFDFRKGDMTLEQLPTVDKPFIETQSMYDMAAEALIGYELTKYIEKEPAKIIPWNKGQYVFNTREEFLLYLECLHSITSDMYKHIPLNYLVNPEALFTTDEYFSKDNVKYRQAIESRRVIDVGTFLKMRAWLAEKGLDVSTPQAIVKSYFSWGFCGMRTERIHEANTIPTEELDRCSVCVSALVSPEGELILPDFIEDKAAYKAEESGARSELEVDGYKPVLARKSYYPQLWSVDTADGWVVRTNVGQVVFTNTVYVNQVMVSPALQITYPVKDSQLYVEPYKWSWTDKQFNTDMRLAIAANKVQKLLTEDYLSTFETLQSTGLSAEDAIVFMASTLEGVSIMQTLVSEDELAPTQYKASDKEITAEKLRPAIRKYLNRDADSAYIPETGEQEFISQCAEGLICLGHTAKGIQCDTAYNAKQILYLLEALVYVAGMDLNRAYATLIEAIENAEGLSSVDVTFYPNNPEKDIYQVSATVGRSSAALGGQQLDMLTYRGKQAMDSPSLLYATHVITTPPSTGAIPRAIGVMGYRFSAVEARWPQKDIATLLRNHGLCGEIYVGMSDLARDTVNAQTEVHAANIVMSLALRRPTYKLPGDRVINLVYNPSGKFDLVGDTLTVTTDYSKFVYPFADSIDSYIHHVYNYGAFTNYFTNVLVSLDKVTTLNGNLLPAVDIITLFLNATVVKPGLTKEAFKYAYCDLFSKCRAIVAQNAKENMLSLEDYYYYLSQLSRYLKDTKTILDKVPTPTEVKKFILDAESFNVRDTIDPNSTFYDAHKASEYVQMIEASIEHCNPQVIEGVSWGITKHDAIVSFDPETLLLKAGSEDNYKFRRFEGFSDVDIDVEDYITALDFGAFNKRKEVEFNTECTAVIHNGQEISLADISVLFGQGYHINRVNNRHYLLRYNANIMEVIL